MSFLDEARTREFWAKVRTGLAAKQDKLAGTAGQVVGFDTAGGAAAQDGWSNPNLLDNWYFADPVNQQGQEGYVELGYTIDRWRTYTKHGALTVQDYNIRIISRNAFSAMTTIFGQPIENPKTLVGKQVALSVLVGEKIGDGVWAIALRGAKQNNYAWASDLLTLKAGLNWTAISIPSILDIDAMDVRINVTNNSSGDYIDLIAAKLEFGPTQTLAHQDEDGNWILNDPPPNKTLELLKCQRYVYRPSYNFSYFVRASKIATNALYFEIPLPVAMRCSPTFDKSALAITPFVGGAAIAGFTFDSTMASNGYGSVLRINATKANHGLTDAVIDLATILFDANL